MGHEHVAFSNKQKQNKRFASYIVAYNLINSSLFFNDETRTDEQTNGWTGGKFT